VTHIDRGYDDIAGVLKTLGAKVERVGETSAEG
jgi:UDP-N-acetylglucosamine enolpyruvyl transferase